MWIVKEQLEDFIVVEDLTLPEGDGEWFLYFLKKRSRTTLAVIKELYRRYGMKKGDILFGGMKDRDGITYQYLVSKKDLGEMIQTATYTLWKIKEDVKPISRDLLKGNYFSVVVRGTADIDTSYLEKGFINYFDYQRFAVFSEGIAAKLILKRHYKEALWSLLTPGTRSVIRNYFMEENFKQCRKLARTPWERRLFDFLRRKGPKYRDALRYVDGDQRAISMLAYQSYLWNKTVSFLVERYGDDIRYIDVAGQNLAVARNLKVSFKVPFVTWFLAEEWWDLPKPVQEAITKVLHAEGFNDLYELKTKVYGYTLILRYRDMITSVRNIAKLKNESAVRLIFYLPTGSYATMYLKELASFHGEVIQVAS